MNKFISTASAALILLASSAAVQAATISYSDFSSTAGLQLNGSAASINTGGQGFLDANGNRVLRLTNNGSQSSTAFTTNAVSLASNASFSTAFSFRMSNPRGIGDNDGIGADGITFIVQTQSNTAGAAGGGIGYEGINRSMAVEFDSYLNGGVDTDGNHVGIDLNGSMNSVARTPVATRFNDGQLFTAWVDYNGATNLLEVRLATTAVRPESALLSYSVNLASVLTQTDAFVGFGAGTGAGVNDHDIVNWQFQNSFAPIGANAVPVPMAASTGLATFGLMAARRRR